MTAAFWWEQPAWLVLVAVGACALAAYVRFQPATTDAQPRNWTRLAAGAVGGACAAALGAWLISTRTSGGSALLGVMALASACLLTNVLYRRQADRLGAPARVGLVTLRCFSWIVLLVLLARPAWDWESVAWQKPLLVVLLDQSDSMSIADRDGQQTEATRAETANAALRRAREAIGRLDELYELRLRAVGTGGDALSAWEVAPGAPISALAVTLREASALRSRHGAPPAAVVLVSDGADNVSPAGELRRVAAELARQGTALLAVGVGPAPGRMPLVELEPLVVPARLGVRDRLRVPVSARVQGCVGASITLELLWDDTSIDSRTRVIDYEIQHVGDDFDVVPPEPGLHRLTARITLPRELGGTTFQTSTVVDVRDEGVRVLWLEGTPRVEATFAARALAGQPRLELTRRFTLSESNSESTDWSDYDVVVLGDIPTTLSDGALRALNEAVTAHGVGLLLVGGRGFFNDSSFESDAFATVSPTTLVHDEFGLAGPIEFVPTAAGLHHPILLGAADSMKDAAAAGGGWGALPPLGGAALLGEPKPVAVVLAEDGRHHPLLVAQEAGRGRCVAAAWESTWPWALASDEGTAVHRHLWRQLIEWLANRRPQAWVLADQPEYSAASLASAQQQIIVRAGISGLADDGAAWKTNVAARLVLTNGDERTELALERRGDQWVAELTGDTVGRTLLSPGRHELEFSVRPAELTPEHRAEALEARSAFTIVETQLEHRAPTANLRLLRAAAEETVAHGGAYRDVRELPDLLANLARTDRRQQVWTRQRYAAAGREPWTMLVALVVLLSVEWGVRKRVGLA